MMSSMKDLARTPYRKLRTSVHKILGIDVSIPVEKHNHKLITLGTQYGGWALVDSDKLQNSVILSCGLGEDGSFDIEFAAKYNAKVIIVDPTPRAIKHFADIRSRIGLNREVAYLDSGSQSAKAYDLSNVSEAQLILCEKALWDTEKKLRFYTPPDPAHVSHSIVNFQNDYASNTPYIDVESITIDGLLKEYDIAQLELIKLDIEGAEVEVLLDMIKKEIYPHQILVEYDELTKPSKKAKSRIESVHAALMQAGYQLIDKDYTNYLYIFNAD